MNLLSILGLEPRQDEYRDVTIDTNEFLVSDCPSCGIRFLVPMPFYESHLNRQQSFHCPNGHKMLPLRSKP